MNVDQIYASDQQRVVNQAPVPMRISISDWLYFSVNQWEHDYEAMGWPLYHSLKLSFRLKNNGDRIVDEFGLHLMDRLFVYKARKRTYAFQDLQHII